MTINKKIQTPAEIQWRKAYHAERWERYADYVMEVFSKPSVILPRQIAYLNELALCKAA